MITISDTAPSRTCAGFSRREFLRVGGLSLGGLSLAELVGLRELLAGDEQVVRKRSVILVFLQGGPPQHETFDPKMDAPAEVRSQTGEIPTSIPGITFGSTFPRLAKLAQKFSIVRSFASGNGGHTYESVTAGRENPLKASMGAIYALVAGRTHPLTGMPTNALVLPEAVKDGLELKRNFETQAMHTLTPPGDLGPTYAAFNPAGGGELKQDLELRIPRERLTDRRTLLADLDSLRRRYENAKLFELEHRYQQQAFDVIARGLASAFDLSEENPKTIESYDTTSVFKMEEWTKYHNMSRTSNLLGRQLLLARRLCEAGCGFVTVSDCGWDLHADGNSAKGMTAMEALGRQVDKAVAAFIEDIEARGMRDEILLIVTGEMGRTPKVNNRGGRDHWGNLTPLLVYGGGLEMGRVIGRSDRQGGNPDSERYTPRHLMATVMHTLFDLGKLRLQQDLPPAFLKYLDESKPIRELVS